MTTALSVLFTAAALLPTVPALIITGRAPRRTVPTMLVIFPPTPTPGETGAVPSDQRIPSADGHRVERLRAYHAACTERQLAYEIW